MDPRLLAFSWQRALGQLLNDLSSYIDAKRMELATNKLAKSALSNFKNMLPLVSDDWFLYGVTRNDFEDFCSKNNLDLNNKDPDDMNWRRLLWGL